MLPGFGAVAGAGADGFLFFLEEEDGFFDLPLPLPAAVGEDTAAAEHVWRPTFGSQPEAGGQHRQLPQEGQFPFFHERWASQGMEIHVGRRGVTKRLSHGGT